MFKIKKLTRELFNEYEKTLCNIQLEAVTNGHTPQYLDPEIEKTFLKNLLIDGSYALCIFDQKTPVGMMFCTPLKYVEDLTDSIKNRYPLDKCFHIHEFHIDKNYRRKGLGSKLMNKFLDDMKKLEHPYVSVRSWKKNIAAMRFYEKFGFKKDDIIFQTRIKEDRITKFSAEKQFLFKRLL